MSSPADSLLLLVFCVGAMITRPPEPPAAATVTAVVADADEAAAAVATVTAGRTAAAGVDVADLSVLAATGVGGDVPTRGGVDVVAGVVDVVVLAAGLTLEPCPASTSPVLSPSLSSPTMLPSPLTFVVSTSPSMVPCSRRRRRRRCIVTAEVEFQVDVADALLNVLASPRAADVVVAGEAVGVARAVSGANARLRREGQAVVVGDRVLQRLDRVARRRRAAGATTAEAACVSCAWVTAVPMACEAACVGLAMNARTSSGSAPGRVRPRSQSKRKEMGFVIFECLSGECFVVVVTGLSGDLGIRYGPGNPAGNGVGAPPYGTRMPGYVGGPPLGD